MNLDAETGISLYHKAIEEKKDNRFFLQWVVQLPYMDKDSFISFDEYRKNLTGANIDMRPTEVILAELDEAEKRLEKAGEKNGT